MKIRIAFYKGKGKWKEKIIRWWTKSPYSHAELIMPDNYTWISISPLLTSTVSSRIKTDFDLQKWDFIEFEITQEQHNVLMDFFDDTKGCKYDWIGMIMSQLIPYSIKRKNKWYCSEWIAYALRIAGVINWRSIKIYNRCDLSPGMLYNLVIEEKEENIETSA